MEVDNSESASKELIESSVPPAIGSETNNMDPKPQKKVRRRKKKTKEGPKFPHTGILPMRSEYIII